MGIGGHRMSEIEKMYENAEVKKQIPKVCSSNELYCKECKAHIEDAMPYCKNAEYPPFTAEKQLKILCFIVNKKHSVTFHNQVFGGDKLTLEKIQENLTWAINRIWQDLTEEERKQIADILEG